MNGETTELVKSLEAEVCRLQAGLEAQGRTWAQNGLLTTLGRLVPAVCHEMSNALTALVVRSGMVQMASTLEDAREQMILIEEQAQRAARVLKNLSAFARPRESGRAPVDLNQTVRAALEVHGDKLATGTVSLVLDLAPDLPVVEGDAHGLQQVVMNLLLNAEEATAGTQIPGTLMIRTEAVGQWVRLSIRNGGPGTPPGAASGLSEAFHAARDHERIDLGFEIARGLVTAHGGEMTVDACEGAGTIATVTLPCGERVEPGHRAPVQPEAAAGRGSLLIVDDESDVGELLSELLRRKGYEAEYVGSSATALERVRAHDFQGVLMDLRMPVMSGAELWQALRRERPALARKTIFMTGDQARPETAAFLQAAAQPFLSKPFRSADIDAALAKIDPAVSRA